ncbi:alpha/beta hydrolase [Methylocaldum sp.]|uniref:alpha/beta hydrolase n=1 Tax=Methylocaldum sp. TaxID=1969727 RepID=UPI002D6F2A14|nr:alpha/beta hydrolase [Methylocaldum sp.]HYE37767.1 alpha/beta hydrolase [Methylocaldum sp.]
MATTLFPSYGKPPLFVSHPAKRSPRAAPLSTPFDFVGNLRTAEGATIRYGVARPADAVKRGSVLLLQGRAECLEKYREVVEGLTARGLYVYSFDWHGQGLSERFLKGRKKVDVKSFDDYLEDIALFIREVWCFPEAHRYIIAHSTGGHVALRFMAERRLKVDGALLCAPMIDLKTQGWPRWFAPIMVGAVAGMGLAECQIPGERHHLPSVRQFEGNCLTGDPKRFRILPELVKTNPELERRGATYRWVRSAFVSIAKLNAPGIAESIAAPVTILIGDDDRIVDAEAAQCFAGRLPNGRLLLLEGARHEIMMERDAILSRFWEAVDDMMTAGRAELKTAAGL